MSDFVGKATPFTGSAIAKAAEQIGCDEAAIRAVIDVESRGGFLKDKRPKILFERHHFHRHTGGRHSATHDAISRDKAGGYKGNAAEYERLSLAIQLDREAALKSASWGAFQIMGSNYKAAGFNNVEEFCRAMCQGEDEHLLAFVSFVKTNRLDDELCRRDWDGFARGYNGPNYRKYRYSEKLAAAYIVHSTLTPRTDAEPRRTLKMGDEGDDVEWLQERLSVVVDGDFGPSTKRALIEFQERQGLTADGIAGAKTLATLRR
jgi:hypothetical protein